MLSMRSGKPTCAPSRYSGVSTVMPLKQFQFSSNWRWPFLVLSKTIVERFLFLRLSPPGDLWCDVLGFVPVGIVSQSTQLLKSSDLDASRLCWLLCPPDYLSSTLDGLWGLSHQRRLWHPEESALPAGHSRRCLHLLGLQCTRFTAIKERAEDTGCFHLHVGAHGQLVVVPYSLCEPGQCGDSSPCAFVQLCFQGEVVSNGGPEISECMDDLLHIVIDTLVYYDVNTCVSLFREHASYKCRANGDRECIFSLWSFCLEFTTTPHQNYTQKTNL